MSNYYIWWLDQRACELIQERKLLPKLPDYLFGEYRSRLGRPGRGRLWIASEIPIKEIEWDESKPAARIADSYGGIVIRGSDAALVFPLPGFLTDLEMNFINELPEEDILMMMGDLLEMTRKRDYQWDDEDFDRREAIQKRFDEMTREDEPLTDDEEQTLADYGDELAP